MRKPLSVDLRSRLVSAVAGGLSRRAAAERFGVSAQRQRHTSRHRGGRSNPSPLAPSAAIPLASPAEPWAAPPYSTDLNPIENAFSRLKAVLRRAAPRTVDHLWDTIREALPRFTPNECANYFTAAG
jgi:transposase